LGNLKGNRQRVGPTCRLEVHVKVDLRERETERWEMDWNGSGYVI